MKILFVFSENNKTGISNVVKNQAKSIKRNGIDIQYFGIKGKGIQGYIKNIFLLKKYLNEADIDLIHAHYSLSALCATFTFTKKPIIASLMGSDLKLKGIWNLLVSFCSSFIWKKTIIKSETMKKNQKLSNPEIIPNGVDLTRFLPQDKSNSMKEIGWSKVHQHILFLADPSREEKNYALAKASTKRVESQNTQFHTVYDIKRDKVVDYLNACDVLILTSLWEGSPNIIKEAMACNRPIVSTDVGDVRRLFGGIDGCYISTFDEKAFSDKITKALFFSEKQGRTKGRERIKELQLDSDAIAQKIIKLYKKVLI